MAAVSASLLLGGCATTRAGATPHAERDPLEGFNRAMWNVNNGIDKVVLKPVSTVYRTVIPRPARRGVSGVFQNLTEPWSFVNNLLQLRTGRAVQNLGRFVVNTTVGVGGLGDPAKKFGIRPAPEDFGQTLGRWGVGDGAYVVLPLFGPSTLRDGVGMGVGFVADPAQMALTEIGVSNGQQLGLTALEVVDGRAQMAEGGVDSFLKSSLDPYAAAKSAFLQRRSGEILNREEEDDDLPAAGTPDSAPPHPSLDQGSTAFAPVPTASNLPEPKLAAAGVQAAQPLPPGDPQPIGIMPVTTIEVPDVTSPLIGKDVR
jgi:phospholipid-binding lipoprotein MlaA